MVIVKNFTIFLIGTTLEKSNDIFIVFGQSCVYRYFIDSKHLVTIFATYVRQFFRLSNALCQAQRQFQAKVILVELERKNKIISMPTNFCKFCNNLNTLAIQINAHGIFVDYFHCKIATFTFVFELSCLRYIKYCDVESSNWAHYFCEILPFH